MERFVLFTVNGLASGAIYASTALALVIIWRTTRVLNFAQGSQAVASAYVAWQVTDWTGSFWAGLVAALISGLVFGALIQLTIFRGAEKLPPLTTIIVGIGALILIEAVLGMIFSPEKIRVLGNAFDTSKWRVGEFPVVSPQDLFIIGSVLTTMAVLGYVMTQTPLGLRMRAAAFAPTTARLMGVKVNRMLTLGWALAGLAGALAAVLVIPRAAELVPQAMTGVFVLGFIVAVIGGLDSPVGSVVAGLGAGLVLSYVGGYVSSSLMDPAAFVLLMLVLFIKPEGIFSSAQARRV